MKFSTPILAINTVVYTRENLSINFCSCSFCSMERLFRTLRRKKIVLIQILKKRLVLVNIFLQYNLLKKLTRTKLVKSFFGIAVVCIFSAVVYQSTWSKLTGMRGEEALEEYREDFSLSKNSLRSCSSSDFHNPAKSLSTQHWTCRRSSF